MSEKEGIKEGREHKKIFRPCGFYVSVIESDEWKVKMISVKPKGQLSLQKHKYRAEHWVVVKGTALIEINDNEFKLFENQSAFIPKESIHRLKNPGNETLVLIEVQTGSYLGEDDIERFNDNYGRANTFK